MNAEILLRHFDRISEAPDAIPRLRRFILDLAVRGKLVEQDLNDEPAEELLKRIQAEKVRLGLTPRRQDAKKGEKGNSEFRDDFTTGRDMPFVVPGNWRWSQLAEIGFINPRNTAADDLLASFVPMPMISAEYGVPNQHEVRPWGEIKSGYTHFAEGDVGLAKITPCFENGKSTVFRHLTGGIGAGTTELHIVRPVLVNADYLLLFLKCPHFIDSGIPKMTGTAGQKRVPAEYFSRSPFPLPPLAEQHRIVAKVDELMALCDQLEAARNEREARRDRLVVASLHQLQDPEGLTPRHQDAKKDKEADQENLGALAPWRESVFLQNLPCLTTRPEHIKQLRQTILNLAVCGRVVPQNPNDEWAGELLGDRQFCPDIEPWALPSGWAWSSFGLIGEVLGGGTPSKADPEFWNGSIPWVSPKDMKVDVIEDTQDHISETAVENSATRLIPTGSLLMVVRGMILAHSFPTAITAVPVTINQDMKAIVPFRPELIRMLMLLTKGLKPEILRLVLRSTHGTCKLLTEDLFSLPIPIPPLPEQHRIVAKVDELMALCDQLEAQLTATEADSRRLLEAVLHGALA
ncbi:restriction endonuclease subunit S [Methylocaldum sp.]|uniref:restriction endonuclease subunit S n=1 Tax=Methylocaldum sp. TaxID=1969727 RepID=UPI002D406520|nr:restriction endonuclease subunit S [Methylocaldum sp.]HYE37538.1 restriction endonuclease subunit S [Methylocaldum sp.]